MLTKYQAEHRKFKRRFCPLVAYSFPLPPEMQAVGESHFKAMRKFYEAEAERLEKILFGCVTMSSQIANPTMTSWEIKSLVG